MLYGMLPPVPPALAPVLTLPALARAVILAHWGYTVPVLRTQSQANNCHETCLAALLGVDPATLPRMGGRTMGDSPETVAFLRSLGVGLCYCPIRAAVHPAALSLGALQQRHAALRPFQIVLLYGLHPSGERHVVLARLGPEGRVVRLSDPHPDRAGLVVVHGVGWLWPLAHTTGNNGFPLTLFFNGPPWEDPCADLPVDSPRYSSEDQLVCSTDPEPIAQAWAEMATTELEAGEAPFKVTLLVGGSDVYDPNAPDIQAIHARRGVICAEIQEARRLKAEERQRLAAEIAARKAEEGERAMLNRLLHKFHGTGN